MREGVARESGALGFGRVVYPDKGFSLDTQPIRIRLGEPRESSQQMNSDKWKRGARLGMRCRFGKHFEADKCVGKESCCGMASRPRRCR